MKGRKFAGWITIVILLMFNASVVNAQPHFACYDGLLSGDVAFYASFGAGATFVQEMSSPAFSVRIGAETDLFVGELEGSYLSVNSLYDNGYDKAETNSLTTMTLGINLGVKFLQGSQGYLALVLNTGYSLQEEWFHGEHYHDYYGGHGYRGKYYIGAGVSGTVDISPRVGLFAEARYQSIPVDGCGKTKWGGVVFGGVKFYF